MMNNNVRIRENEKRTVPYSGPQRTKDCTNKQKKFT